jgi:hypothetical protein
LDLLPVLHFNQVLLTQHFLLNPLKLSPDLLLLERLESAEVLCLCHGLFPARVSGRGGVEVVDLEIAVSVVQTVSQVRLG